MSDDVQGLPQIVGQNQLAARAQAGQQEQSIVACAGLHDQRRGGQTMNGADINSQIADHGQKFVTAKVVQLEFKLVLIRSLENRQDIRLVNDLRRSLSGRREDCDDYASECAHLFSPLFCKRWFRIAVVGKSLAEPKVFQYFRKLQSMHDLLANSAS